VATSGDYGLAVSDFAVWNVIDRAALSFTKTYTPAIKTGLTSPAGAFNGPVTSAKSEAAAFLAGGESYAAPAQMVGDFLAGRASVGLGNVVLESSSKISLANGISF
jgi:hypothetical protein